MPEPELRHDESTWVFEQRLRQFELFEAYEAPLGEARPLRVASNANRLAALLAAVRQQQTTEVHVLGSRRTVDFSLFTPRGHYVKTNRLRRFFRAMTRLGTVDFRIGGAAPRDNVARAIQRFELQCACVAVHVLREADMLDALETIHEAIAALAGDGVGADSMRPRQLHELLLTSTGAHQYDVLVTCCDIRSDAFISYLQDQIPPPRRTRTHPPTAFALLGQQFVWSAFVFSKLVFDQVIGLDSAAVPRRMVSGVDAAFALFGNDVAAAELAARMAASPRDDGFVMFRDGLPYAANLVAVRQLVDDAFAEIDPATNSMALLWQRALRELSRKSANDATVFQSDAWQKRQMNTQLASFAQLRHDTILYAKQGATCMTACEYPAGFVDPYPSFWLAMKQLAQRTLAIVEQVTLMNGQEPRGHTTAASRQPLSDTQVQFLKTVMEERRGSGSSRYLGWYPSLFYTQRQNSSKPDRLVADVHTDPPSFEHGDPGGILHVGVNDVNLALVVAEDTLYAGPVFSYYELITRADQRLTDDAFSAKLPTLRAPQWARDAFLVAE